MDAVVELDVVDVDVVGCTVAEGRDWPTRPSVRISDSDIVFDDDPLPGSRNCSSSFRLRDAVSEAEEIDVDDVVWIGAEERDELVSTLMVHW